MTKLNSMHLPHKLVLLHNEGMWITEYSLRHFQNRLGVSEHDNVYQFLWLDEMQEDLSILRQLIIEQPNVAANVYAIGSSKLTGAPVHLPMADIDHGFSCITTMEDPLFWLDYRTGPTPQVLFLQLSKGPAFWKIVANDFETFAQEWLGIARSP